MIEAGIAYYKYKLCVVKWRMLHNDVPHCKVYNGSINVQLTMYNNNVQQLE